MALSKKHKGNTASPPPRASTGLKLHIGPQGRKSVLETLDDLDLISRTFAEDEDEEDSEDNDDDGNEDDDEDDNKVEGNEEVENANNKSEEDEAGPVPATPKSLKHKRISKKTNGACTIYITLISH
jgi:hypothetical protein